MYNNKKHILNAYGKIDPELMRSDFVTNNGGTLPHEAFIYMDKRMTEIVQKKIRIFEDLKTYNLIDNSINMGDVIVKYPKISDMTPATVSMNGSTPSQKDRLTYTYASVPIPIFHKDFTIMERDMQSATNKGFSLNGDHISAATKNMAHTLNDMVYKGVDSLVTVNGANLYGLTTFPDRNTYSVPNSWVTGAGDPLQDVTNMINIAETKNFTGPFILYVPSSLSATLQLDYKPEAQKSWKTRIEELNEIEAVKFEGSGLGNNEIVLVEMDQDTIQLKVAQQVISFQQPITRQGQYDFTVMSAMGIVLKSDQEGRCGIVHATGVNP